MKYIHLFLCLLAMSPAFSQTQVNGNQSGTWTLSNSPYEVTGEITVPAGQTLQIEAGVEINFQGYYKFVVKGNLQAIGTETNMIRFTTDNQNQAWGGIRLDHADGISQLTYCRIEYGKTGANYPDNHGGGMALLASDAVLSHCVFANNDATGSNDGMGGAVYAYNTGNSSNTLTRFEDCKFINNHAYGEGGAIKFTSDMNSEIKNCEFIGNNCLYGGGAIAFYSVYHTKMQKCLFAENYTEYSAGGAISTLGTGNTLSLQNCTFSKNEARHGDGGAVNIAYANATFVNCIVYNNPGAYSNNVNLSMDGHVDFTYSDVADMPSEATGNNNIDANPVFINPNSGDFHLASGSPCIDTGTDIGLPFIGSHPDMGCYEYDSATVNELGKYKISVYPNPANEYIYINNIDGFSRIILSDSSGKQVLCNEISEQNNNIRIDLKNIKQGLYLLNFFSDRKHILGHKIIINKR